MNTIQAFDTDDETLYVLQRDGHDPVVAYWPQPLLELAPYATWLASVREDVGHSIVVQVADNSMFATDERDMTAGAERRGGILERRQLRERAARLKRWRQQRPRLTLRTGRKHNVSARLTQEDIRSIQRRHYIGYESLRSICREMWQAKGYASEKSMLNTVCDTLASYGLRKRSPSEMTARSNRDRSMRLPGESKNEFKRRRRREVGYRDTRTGEWRRAA